jgi:hypothetical protein
MTRVAIEYARPPVQNIAPTSSGPSWNWNIYVSCIIAGVFASKYLIIEEWLEDRRIETKCGHSQENTQHCIEQLICACLSVSRTIHIRTLAKDWDWLTPSLATPSAPMCFTRGEVIDKVPINKLTPPAPPAPYSNPAMQLAACLHAIWLTQKDEDKISNHWEDDL